MAESPGFFHGVVVDGFERFSVEVIAQSLQEGIPAGIVEILEDSVPFLVGVVAQFSFVGAFARAPCGDLYAGIPLVEVFFFRCLAGVAGFFNP